MGVSGFIHAPEKHMQMLGLNHSAFTCCKRADSGRQIGEQECIPVGCILPVLVAISGLTGGRGCLCLGGVCPGECLPVGLYIPRGQNSYHTSVKTYPPVTVRRQE